MKETLPFLAILIVVIASPAQTQVSDEATAHVKCFANLSQAQIRGELTLQEMPENLMADVEAILKEDPSQSWDQAVREVAGRTLV